MEYFVSYKNMRMCIFLIFLQIYMVMCSPGQPYKSEHSSLALYLYIKYIHSLHIIHGLLTNKVWIGFNFFDSIKETLSTLRTTMQYKKHKTFLSSLKVISNVFHHCFWRRSMKMIWNICNLTKSQAFYWLGPITIQLAIDRYECKNILIFRIC